ncbi:MAG: hypothetical protein ACXVBV_18315 [Isosphaeraceae bacterium]
MISEVGVRYPSRLRAGALWIAGAVVGLLGGYATLVVHPGLIIPDLLLMLALACARPRLWCIAGAIVGHGLVWSWLLATTSLTCYSLLLPGEAPCSLTLPFQSLNYGGPLGWPKVPGWWLPWSLAGVFGLLLAGLALTAIASRRATNRGFRPAP